METLKKNWKTTLSGLIILSCFVGHVLFPQVVTQGVADGIGLVAAAFGLTSAKDGDVTGIGKNATTIASEALPVLDSLTSHSNNPTMQDVHQIIDKLSGAFVAAAQNSSGAPIVVNTPAPVAATPAPASEPAVVNIVNDAPSQLADFESAVQAEVSRRLQAQSLQ